MGIIKHSRLLSCNGIPDTGGFVVTEWVQGVIIKYFFIDAIIDNSGISHYGLLVDTEKETIEKMMAIHVTSPIYITKELLPKMIRQQKGKILFITSIWGQTGSACEVIYSTVKGAHISFRENH